MKKFAFNLEKVLSLRKFREQETEIELGRAIGALSEIERNIRSLAEERARADSSFSGNGAMIRSYMLYLDRLELQKEELLAQAARAEAKVEEARALFIEASRERKVLDRLKEKREKEHRKAVLVEETKLLDDTASGRPSARS